MYYRMRMTNGVRLLNLSLIKSIRYEKDEVLKIEYPGISYRGFMFNVVLPVQESFKFKSEEDAMKVLDEIHAVTKKMY